MASETASGMIIFIVIIFATTGAIFAITTTISDQTTPLKPAVREISDLSNTNIKILTIIYDAETEPDTLTIYAKNEGRTNIRFEELFLYITNTLIETKTITIEEDTKKTRDDIWEPQEIIKIEVLGAIATGTRDVRLQTSKGINAARTHFFLSNAPFDAQIIEYPPGMCTIDITGTNEALQGDTHTYQSNIEWEFARAGNLARTEFLRDGVQICSTTHSGASGTSINNCDINFPNDGNVTILARGVFGLDGVQCQDEIIVDVEPVIQPSCTVAFTSVPTNTTQGETEQVTANIEWQGATIPNDQLSIEFLRGSTTICTQQYNQETGNEFEDCNIDFPITGTQSLTVRGNFEQSGIQCEDTTTILVEEEPTIDAACQISFTSTPTTTFEGETEQVTANIEWQGATIPNDQLSIEFLRGSTTICTQQYNQETGNENENCNINFPTLGMQDITVRGNFEQSGILCVDTETVEVLEEPQDDTTCNIQILELSRFPGYERQQFNVNVNFETTVQPGSNVGIQITGGPDLDISNCNYEAITSSGEYTYSCLANFETIGTGRSVTATCVENNSPPALDFETITGINIAQSTCPENMPAIGTQDHPCQITTPTHFMAIDDTTTNWGLHYELMDDIDMSSTSFNGLRRGFTYFTGSLDGNYHTISGFDLNTNVASSGVFSRLRGTLKNVKFEGTGTIGEGESGLVVGRMEGTSSTNKAIISNVSLIGTATLNQQDTGAFVGQMFGNSLIENSFFEGEVNIGGFARGPFVGRVINSANTIRNSYTNTDLTSSSPNHAGLFVSQISGNAEIENVLATGTTNVVNGFIGAIVMEEPGSATYSGSYWNTDSNLPHAVGTGFNSGINPAGTTARTTAQLKQGSAQYPTWDTEIWGFNDPTRNEGYPYLRWYFEN
ncbi:MAG: hypothetical protein ACMXX7_02220 [Candidatus Woesearchaeota archaeon]